MTEMNSLPIVDGIQKTIDKDVENAINFVAEAITKNISSKPRPTFNSLSESEEFWRQNVSVEEQLVTLSFTESSDDAQEATNAAATRLFLAFD